VGDAPALAEKIGLLIHDADLRARLGDQAVAYAQKFAWPIIAEQIVDLYRSLTRVAA
jgi:glycosyltransferase involved in cell wall biosynthesis